MKKSILPKHWEISELAVTLTDFTDFDNPQQITVTFDDIGGGFYPAITTKEKVEFNPQELRKFAELADKVCKTLDYMSKANYESTKIK